MGGSETTAEVEVSTSTAAPESSEEEDTPAWFNAIFYLSFIVVMVGMGTTVSIPALKDRLSQPKGIAIAWVHQFIILPFLAYLLTEAFGTPEIYAVALRIQSMCPGGTMSNVLCFLGMADVPISIACTTLSTISALFMMPFNLFLYLSDQSDLEFTDIIPSMLVSLMIVLVGTCVGMTMMEYCEKVGARFQNAAGPALVVIIGLVVYNMATTGENPFNPEDPALVLIPCFLIPTLALISTMGFGTLFGIPTQQRIAISLETSVQNQALALSLLYQIYDGDDQTKAAAVPILYSVGGLTANWGTLILCYYIGWSYADPKLSFCENFDKARDHMRNGTYPGQTDDEDDNDAGDVENADKRKPDTEMSETTEINVTKRS